MSKGYIYALINSSLKGLVKVGKTTRDPEDRAKEISIGTGVPTEFMVAYKVFVDDCDYAEKYLHNLLESKGYRVNQNREFFKAPLEEIINIMLQIKDKPIENIDYYDDAFLNSLYLESKNEYIYKDILDQAEEYYYGLGDSIRDVAEALKLYKKAIDLGAIEAYSRVGAIYINGEGCKKDFQMALKFLKDGVNKGNENCYAEMGILFTIENNFENSRKCYKKYFESNTFKENKSDNLGTDRIFYVMSYLSDVRLNGLNLDFIEYLAGIRDEIYEAFQKSLEYFRNNNSSIINSYEKGMLEIFEKIDYFNRN